MKRIGIILTSLGEGGAQRSGVVLAQLLANFGYDITIIITQYEIAYDYSGKLYSVYEHANHKNKLIKAFRTFTSFKNIVASCHFDCIIDGRHRATWLKQRFITSFIYGKLPVIYIVHSYNISDYLPKKRWMVKDIYRNASKVVGVSDGICDRITQSYGLDNVTRIYNTIFSKSLQELADKQEKIPEEPYILYYGRLLENEKNVSFLLHAYVKSILPEKKIKLVLLGSGKDEGYYKSFVKELDCEKNVVFMKFRPNPFPIVQKALFTTLTSNYEGFPMVLIESLLLGTPVVSVNCPSGPSEVIQTGINGILTAQHDQEAFVTALNKMVVDIKFYEYCKSNATKSIAHLSPDIIGNQWENLLGEVLKK